MGTKDSKASARRARRSTVVKIVLELGPLALFFVAYGKLGIFAATGILMVCVVVTLGISYAILCRIPIMPLVTAVIVVIFGWLTLLSR